MERIRLGTSYICRGVDDIINNIRMRFGAIENLQPPDDDFEQEDHRCCICDQWDAEHNMVKDLIQENWLCKNQYCIVASKEIDLEYSEGSERMKAEEYYNNLLKQVK